MSCSENPESPRGGYADVTRRGFLIAGGAGAVLTAIPRMAVGQDQPSLRTSAHSPGPMKVSLKINGETRNLELDARTTLLDALREHLHLTGTKKGCDQGQCGACTVIVDGRRINSCLTLAVMHDGGEVTTIEGLGSPENLHPLQAAFVKCDGYQCGYCTPGQICSGVAMLEEIRAGIPSHVTDDLMEDPEPGESEFRERMSGNLCRCGAYSNIIEAITEVAAGGKK